MDFSTLEKNLQKHGYRTRVCADREEAAAHFERTLEGETVGFGGSVTVDELGLYDRLAKNNAVVWHWRNPEDRQRYPEFTAYVSSVNAIAETGEMVNIDGSGNRVAATLFGPKKMYFVVGRNKVRPDLASAIDRARNIASPPNCKRLNKATPCVKDGKCHDCDSPERICNVLCVYWRPMVGTTHSEVVLVDEDLGF